MRSARTVLLVLGALVMSACFKTQAVSTVGADGTAATRIAIELDLGQFEEIFGGLAEEFGGEQPSIIDEASADLDSFEVELDELYAQTPGLRDRFQASVGIDGDVLRTELALLTPTPEALGQLFDSILGSGNTDLGEIIGVDGLVLPGEEDGLGGGTGVFSSVSVTLDDEFSFEARPPEGADFGDDLELEFDLFDGLTPEIVIEITAPGDIIDTNGSVSGRTVTWELDGTESDALRLRSDVDPTSVVEGLDAIGSLSSDGGFPWALVVSLLILALLVGGAIVLLRQTGDRDPAPTSGDADAI